MVSRRGTQGVLLQAEAITDWRGRHVAETPNPHVKLSRKCNSEPRWPRLHTGAPEPRKPRVVHRMQSSVPMTTVAIDVEFIRNKWRSELSVGRNGSSSCSVKASVVSAELAVLTKMILSETILYSTVRSCRSQ